MRLCRGCVIIRKSNRPFIPAKDYSEFHLIIIGGMNDRLELRIITQPHSEVNFEHFRRLVFGNSLAKYNKLTSYSYSVVIFSSRFPTYRIVFMLNLPISHVCVSPVIIVILVGGNWALPLFLGVNNGLSDQSTGGNMTFRLL